MIIKSHVSGGYLASAEYLKDQGANERTRLVDISDPAAKNLEEAFHNMWVVASNTKCTKPLHHISINPMIGERLTDKQVRAVIERCEQKYDYKLFHHQRVIVEHIKKERQHFHVVWNRVSLMTGRNVWPGEHWNKSKQVCREMERELGLKRPIPRRTKRAIDYLVRTGRIVRSGNRYSLAMARGKTLSFNPPTLGGGQIKSFSPSTRRYRAPPAILAHPGLSSAKRKFGHWPKDQKNRDIIDFRDREWTTAELIAWAWEHARWDILARFGIFLTQGFFEP